MFSNDRKTIGVFIFRPAEEFQNKLCQGIIDRGTEKGYNVAFFTSFGEYSHNDRFIAGERQMLHLPPYERLSGAILVLDTMDMTGFEEELLREINERCDCPVVCVRKSIEGYHSVVTDDDVSMEEVIEHFIVHHQFTKICFMSGPEHMEDAQKRLGCFYRIMKKHNLEVTPQQVFHGDFWMRMAQEACDHFIQDDYMPEVIICANDYMAISVCSELIRRGYEIPEDLCVSGYDGMDSASIFYPAITSVKVPIHEMGTGAVDLVDRHQKDNQAKCEKVYFPTRLVLSDSCGCSSEGKHDIMRNRRDSHEATLMTRRQFTQASFMSIDLGKIESISALSQIIHHYLDSVEGYESYYLCLYEGLEAPGKRIEISAKEATVARVRVAVKEREPIDPVNISFPVEDLLPQEVSGYLPQVFFFCPLHYQEHCFGYEAFSFLESKVSGKLFLPWSINISNAIEEILVQNQLRGLIDELEYMYVRDMLTGLMNRRGFVKYGEVLLNEARKNKTSLLVVSLDMDGLKTINDSFGHAEGDYALQIAATAMEAAANSDMVVARMGGDEYALVAACATDYEMKELLGNIEQNIVNLNIKAAKPYQVQLSYGVYFGVPGEEDTLESCLRVSDHRMYDNKVERKRKSNTD